MSKSKTTHNPLGAGVTEGEPKIPPQTTNSESEFSVNESLKQSVAEEREKEQQRAGSDKAEQQGGERSSESEFSVEQPGHNRQNDQS